MPAWTVHRYWCTNVGGRCPHALADTPFDQKQFDAWHGLCGAGPGEHGCGQALQGGELRDPRARRVLIGGTALATLALLGWAARPVLFPSPLERVAFAASETRTEEGRSSLSIEVVRSAALDQRVEVLCRLVDGSAKAGVDFQATTDRLVFEAGERSKALPIALLPDASHQRGERHFAVALANVAGEPRHVVVIAPKPVDRSAQLQAEQMVMMASRTAADIASLAVKHEVLDELLTGSRNDPVGFRNYKLQLAEVDGNLMRAREGYAQALRDLRTHPSVLVLDAMTRLQQDLDRREFGQQSKAVGVMKRQFGELLQHDTMDMDRWVRDLSVIVPRAPGGPSAKPSV